MISRHPSHESHDSADPIGDEPLTIDVDFSVPVRHRVRFTQDLARGEMDVLLAVLEPSEAHQPRVLVVVDEEVADANCRVDEIVNSLIDSNRVHVVAAQGDSLACRIPGGERVKHGSSHIKRLLDLINTHDLDRRSYIVVIGGGAVLDAVGFAAATAHRGIRLVRLPTTTLAQDDSGVGVKNAINYFGKKNWVGTFAVPWAVINDAGLLETLPDRDFRCGFSEAVKVSLLKSTADFKTLCTSATRIYQRDMRVAIPAIQRSCIWHLRHITEGGDPFEAREARPLDFGHWSAHKMEQLSDYSIRHGEAVAIGVALDCIYSTRQHGLPRESMLQVCHCLRQLGLSLWHKTLDTPDIVLNGLEEFRQHLGGRLTVTMLRDIASPVDVHEVDPAAMRQSMQELREIAADMADLTASTGTSDLALA